VSVPAALVVAVVAAAAAVVLAGCSSSFDQARTLEREGAKAAAPQKGLSIGRANPDVTVADSAVVTDANGSAVVLTLKSTAKEDQRDVPIAIDVRGAKRATVFKNDAPGLEPSLTEMSVVEAGKETDWVNDQVVPSAPPRDVEAKVGAPKSPAATAVPKLTVSGVTLQNDPTSGVLASGRVKNDSTVPQTKLVAYGVARKGAKVVAAGRAVIPKLIPGKTAIFRIYFIGDPRKGKLTVNVPPSSFR
jgi:hypothetical protein